jgi:hypothetical protein
MGLSRLTAYAIATRDVIVTAGGPDKDGKFMGWITFGEEENYRPLLNTGPDYDSEEDAKKAMQEIKDEIVKFVENETKGKEPIDHLMEEAGMTEEKEVIKEVIRKSKA